MYLDQLDTVRFNEQYFNVEQNYLFAEVAMMKNIIEGNTITLSQSQLFDSGIILKLLKNADFIETFKNGKIAVAMLESDYKKTGINSFKDIVIDKLGQGINDDKPYFYFSGIDSLNNKKLYSDNDKSNIETPRKLAIEILKSNGNYSDSCKNEHTQYFDDLKNFANIIDSISEPITKQNIVAKKSKHSLSELIGGYLFKAEHTDKLSERNYIKTLRKVYDELVSQRRADARSAYYSLAEKYEKDALDNIASIKAIVDFCYNLVVADSVSQSNDNLRELTFDRKKLDVIEKKILIELCKTNYSYEVRNKIQYSDINFENDKEIVDLENGIESEIITWKNINNLPDLPSNTLLRKAFDNCIINLSTPYHRYHKVLCKAVPIVASVVGVAMFNEQINTPSEIISMYHLIKELTIDTDKILEEILELSKVNEAKARRIIYNVQERALRIKGVK